MHGGNAQVKFNVRDFDRIVVNPDLSGLIGEKKSPDFLPPALECFGNACFGNSTGEKETSQCDNNKRNVSFPVIFTAYLFSIFNDCLQRAAIYGKMTR